MTSVQETREQSATATRSYKEIATDPKTNQEDRHAARIRHNLTTYLTSYFSGPKDGDGEVIFQIIATQEIKGKGIAARVIMLNGEVKDGFLTSIDGRNKLTRSKRTSNKDLIETSQHLPVHILRNVRRAFTSDALLHPFKFPTYTPAQFDNQPKKSPNPQSGNNKSNK